MILRLPRFPRLMLALSWLAQAAVAQDLFINDPDNPMSCFPVAMRWSGGVSPYTVYVMSASAPNGSPIELAVDNWTADVKGLAWYIDIVQGAELVLKIVDGTGASASTNAFTVRPPADPLTCARFNLKDPSKMTLTGGATATAPTTGGGSNGGTAGGSTGPTSAPGSPPHTDSSAHGSSTSSGTTGTPLANTPASPNDAKPGSPPLGPILGGAIVGGVVVFVVMFGILIYCRRKRHLHENGTGVEGNHPYPSAHLRRKSLKFDEITTASNLSNDDFASHIKPTRIGAISPPLPLQLGSRPATPVVAYEYVTSPRTPNGPGSPAEKTRPTSPSIMRVSVISPLNNDSMDDLTQGGASGSDGHAADRSSTSESGMSGRPTYSRASTFTAPSPSGGSLARLVNTTRAHRAGTGGSSMSMSMGQMRALEQNSVSMPATPPRPVSGLEYKEWTDWAAATNHSLVSSRSSYSRV